MADSTDSITSPATQLRCILARIPDFFYSVAWSPDGRIVATGSADRTVRLWEAGSGQLMHTFKGHTGRVRSVAWSADGNILASGAEDGAVRLWDPHSRRLLRTLRGHNRRVWSVAWSSDGKTLASGAEDHTVRLWDCHNRELPRILEGHRDWVRSVAWSADGNILASGAADGSVRLWDPHTGRLLRTLEGHTGRIRNVAWSADGNILASGTNNGTVRLWDPHSGRLLRTLEVHTDSARSVAWSADGSTLASGADDGTVRLWNPHSGKLLRTFEGHTDSVRSVAWSADGNILASGSADHIVRLCDLNSGKLLRTLEGHTGIVRSVAWSADGNILASGAADRTVRLWDSHSGKLLCTLEGHTDSVRSVAWSASGVLASSANDGTVRLWNPHSGKLLCTLEGHTGRVRTVAWSIDNSTLASGATDRTVRLWNPSSGKLLRTLKGHTDSVRNVAWSADSKTLASCAADRTVRLWDPYSGRPLLTLEGHTDSVRSIAWSADSHMLASGAADRTVRSWNAITGAGLKVYSIDCPDHYIANVCFHPTVPIVDTLKEIRLGDPDLIIRSLTRDMGTDLATMRHISAKIVLVGESNVGKSCLALRLAQDRYEEQGTTHGMQLWSVSPKQLCPTLNTPPGEQREVVLWDLGGHKEYRLVHQLFLHDTTLALLLLDPTRDTAFEDVTEWNLRLEKQLRGRKATKLLVGTKLDEKEEQTRLIDQAGLGRLLKTSGFVGFYPTSAKVPLGIEELREAIAQAINWSELSQTSRPLLFQRIHEAVTERQQRGEVMLLYAELEQQIRATLPDQFDPAAVETVVDQLALQGCIANTRLASGQRVLVLQVGLIELYAGSLIVAARNNSRGVPALEVADVIGMKSLPGIKDDERLNPFQERIVLECMMQLLLEHGVCLKHEGLLIFPSLFPETMARDQANIAQTVSLYYDFSGAIDNIYSSLVVRLALSGHFGRVRLSKDRAEYERPDQGLCGLRKSNRSLPPYCGRGARGRPARRSAIADCR